MSSVFNLIVLFAMIDSHDIKAGLLIITVVAREIEMCKTAKNEVE